MRPDPDTSSEKTKSLSWNSGFLGINSATVNAVIDRFRRVRHLIRKEFVQITRNKQNFRLLMIAPLLQLFMFGYACRLDVENVATVVVDLDRTTLSRDIIEAFLQVRLFSNRRQGKFL